MYISAIVFTVTLIFLIYWIYRQFHKSTSKKISKESDRQAASLAQASVEFISDLSEKKTTIDFGCQTDQIF